MSSPCPLHIFSGDKTLVFADEWLGVGVEGVGPANPVALRKPAALPGAAARGRRAAAAAPDEAGVEADEPQGECGQLGPRARAFSEAKRAAASLSHVFEWRKHMCDTKPGQFGPGANSILGESGNLHSRGCQIYVTFGTPVPPCAAF